MKPKQQLIDEGIIDDSKITTKHSIAQFYQDQLNKFEKLGMGKQTDNGVLITPTLLKITEERLKQLRPFLRGKKGDSNGTV